MWSSSSRDNWERLVAAVVKRQQIWELCHDHSRSPSISTISSLDDFSERILSFPNSSLEPFSVSPSPPLLPIIPSVSQVRKIASSRLITWKLFSAWHGRRKSKDEDLVDIPEDVAVHLQLLRRFSLHELRVATVDFSLNCMDARDVYRGWLADGSQVAVKRFRDPTSSEILFRREVEINSITSHPNVIHILGFCITRRKEYLLVYPWMVSGSVRTRTQARRESQPPLSWTTRKGIALGAARGLAYLHEELCDKKIIHRDIKAANILLNKDFEAVVAHFGLSIIAEHSTSYVEDAVVGTFGHLAPEYLSAGNCSEKNDVFGYGIFLLELITGQRAFDLGSLANDEDMMLQDWVKRICKERKWEIIVDADCGSNYMDDEVEQLLQISLLCTKADPEGRPKMSEVFRMIEGGDGLAERWDELVEKEKLKVEKVWLRDGMSWLKKKKILNIRK